MKRLETIPRGLYFGCPKPLIVACIVLLSELSLTSMLVVFGTRFCKFPPRRPLLVAALWSLLHTDVVPAIPNSDLPSLDHLRCGPIVAKLMTTENE
uniref:Secreted protein n=1 Tax=Steinernema glaseri TaxID=37863 RepID=A0A1I7YIR2_9BILA